MGKKSTVSKDERVEQRFRRLRKERQKKAKKIYKILALVFSVWMFLLAIVNLVKPSSDFSESENRMLAQMPHLSMTTLADGSFMKGVESYISDQFLFRDGWISLKLMEDKLLGKKESNGVYLGKNGYLMEKPDTPNEQAMNNNLAAIREFYSRHTDLNIYMTLVPNSFYILQDKLPGNAPIRNQEKDIAAVKEALGNTVTFLDVTTALKDHAKEDIYYKTDHHWTSTGAYYAFLSMSAGMGISNSIESYNVYTVTKDFQGTLASKSGYHGSRDAIQIYEPQGIENDYIVTYEDDMSKSGSMYRSESLSEKDKYTVFFGGNHSLIDIQIPAETNRILLVFKDSYANCLIPFLTPYFKEIVIVDPRYYYDSIDQVIARRGITDVLYLYNMNTFVGDTSLADTLAADEGGVTAGTDTEAPSLNTLTTQTDETGEDEEAADDSDPSTGDTLEETIYGTYTDSTNTDTNNYNYYDGSSESDAYGYENTDTGDYSYENTGIDDYSDTDTTYTW